MAKIYLNGYMDAPVEAVEAVNVALKEHVRLTKAEDGCEKFEVSLSEEKSGRFIVSEIFSCKESFEAHQVRVKSSEWGKVTESYPRHYKIEEK